MVPQGTPSPHVPGQAKNRWYPDSHRGAGVTSPANTGVYMQLQEMSILSQANFVMTAGGSVHWFALQILLSLQSMSDSQPLS
jgi:hypothetical protein